MIEISNYQTQWTAQFLIAAELTSRGYLANFSLGNARFADIQAETPEGKQFAVDVKGQKTKGYWRIKGRIHTANQYYILVYVPQSKENKDRLLIKDARYFILSAQQVEEEQALDYEQANLGRINSGKPTLKPYAAGIHWGPAEKYEDMWQTLPERAALAGDRDERAA